MARIARGVDELYSLRYFEDITYEVFPGAEETIDLCLGLRELPGGNFRVGLRYDTYHKLVAAAGVYAINLAFPGLRLETELEAAGLTRILTKLSYPTETLSFPVYPLAYGRYQDIPTRLYGGGGRSGRLPEPFFGLGAGLGFLQKSLTWSWSELERMNVDPGLSSPRSGPDIFGSRAAESRAESHARHSG
jgi:outer membrane protein assembly factor BamA